LVETFVKNVETFPDRNAENCASKIPHRYREIVKKKTKRYHSVIDHA